MKIRLIKVNQTENGLPPIPKDQYIPGTLVREGFSLPIEHSIEGFLIYPIKNGYPVYVNRTKRNEVDVLGTFKTSNVIDIGNNYFKTENSVYNYEIIEK
jgi:hypothetical protein